MKLNLKKNFDFIKEIISQFFKDGCMNLAAALSYYTLFSVAPLLVIVTAIASLFMGDQTVQTEINKQISNMAGDEAAAFIETMIEHAYQPKESMLATWIGFFTLLVGATSVFVNIQNSLNTVWGVRPRPRNGIIKWFLNRTISFGMILAIGFLLLVSLVVNAVLAAFTNYLLQLYPHAAVFLLRILEVVITLGINALLFAMIFKFLPDVKIRWSDVRTGAIVTSVLFAVGRIAIGFYLGSSHVASAYGAAGAIVIIILWVYYSALILFFGAEFTQVYASRYGSKIIPDDYAVRVLKVEEELNIKAPTDKNLDDLKTEAI
jgi:membrane protein